MDARIIEMNAALDQYEAALEAMKAEYNATLQDRDVVGPNLALAVARLRHTYRKLQHLGEKMESFILLKEYLLLSNGITLIGEHNPADPVPIGPDVGEHDEPEEHDPSEAVPVGTVVAAHDEPEEHDTAASVVSVEDNWHQNALQPNNN